MAMSRLKTAEIRPATLAQLADDIATACKLNMPNIMHDAREAEAPNQSRVIEKNASLLKVMDESKGLKSSPAWKANADEVGAFVPVVRAGLQKLALAPFLQSVKGEELNYNKIRQIVFDHIKA